MTATAIATEQPTNFTTGVETPDPCIQLGSGYLEEEEAGLLVEDGVRATAGVAGHILLDVPVHSIQ